MDKKYIVLAGAAIMVLVLLFEPLSRGGGIPSGTTLTPGENVTGTTVFNGTIRTYDPILYLNSSVEQSVIDELRNHQGVRDVRSETNIYVVQTETRDDVYPIASWLREKNISSYAIANIAVSSDMIVKTATSDIDATILGGVVKVVTEPLIDAGESVSVSMVAVVSSGHVIDYSSASVLLEPVDIVLDAEVESLESLIAVYSIPWESRNGLDLSGMDATYTQVDSIIFTTPLTVTQVMTKKQFSYITYIDANSAQVEPSFDNMTLLETNFQDTPYSLPDSTLEVSGEELPELNYTADSTYYNYVLRLLDSPYEMDETMALESGEEYEIGETLQVNISALVLGDQVLSVTHVSLPS